ncbi:hypothetical protein Fmac_021179 [Flemingia macrophylla]|uniref:Uncharacterized protein n=1 Tax=Flemingia macrophylla TaxID=520843 RepID=A0ABD1LWD1_9FABA
MPNFTSAKNLKYLDFDGCASLSLVHESIGALSKLTLLSLRDCKNLVRLPSTINAIISLQTLDLRVCLKVKDLPVGQYFDSLSLVSLIVLDLCFCNLLEVPDAIKELRCLERLNLQGNQFISMPPISSLHRLAYLNLSHCKKVEILFESLPILKVSSGGKYFKTVSGSRDHRSGLYIFDCPMLTKMFMCTDCRQLMLLYWLANLIKYPCHFRAGFDIVVPWITVVADLISRWFQSKLTETSIIRIKNFNSKEDWLGFVFYAIFKSGFKIITWGLRTVSKQDLCRLKRMDCAPPLAFDFVTNDMTNSGPKIRLPYNWLVTKKDEDENIEAKTKENNLSNVGL